MLIEIPGTPIAKIRHRIKRIGNKIMSYDPQEKEKEVVRGILTHQLHQAFDEPGSDMAWEASDLACSSLFKVEMTFHMPYPCKELNSALKRNGTLWHFHNTDTSRLDLSNMIKFYEDAANGVLYQDDKQIVVLKAKKIYSLNPRTIINITPVKPMTLSDSTQGILEEISPNDFKDLLEITNVLSNFSSHIGTDDPLEILEEDHELYRSRLNQAACYLSLMAERFAPLLTKIKKKYPNYHVHHESLEVCKADLHSNQRNGKTLC